MADETTPVWEAWAGLQQDWTVTLPQDVGQEFQVQALADVL